MKTMFGIGLLMAAGALATSAMAEDFSYPNLPRDGGIYVIADGEFQVESYRATCYNTSTNVNQPEPCDWGIRTFTAYGPQWPKWVPVVAGSPFAVYGADSVTFLVGGSPMQLSGTY